MDTNAGIIAGHGRVLAARKLGLDQVPVVVLDHLSETQKRAYVLADNQSVRTRDGMTRLLRGRVDGPQGGRPRPEFLGFREDEVAALLAEDARDAAAGEAEAPEEIPEAPVEPVTRPGDIWVDRKAPADLRRLPRFSTIAATIRWNRANMAITSPPYASQRAYDPSSGFRPVPPGEYVAWFREVAANIAAILAPDGSYFLNIKEHADGGAAQSVRQEAHDRASSSSGVGGL